LADRGARPEIHLVVHICAPRRYSPASAFRRTSSLHRSEGRGT
jgi:hypothetical protein